MKQFILPPEDVLWFDKGIFSKKSDNFSTFAMSTNHLISSWPTTGASPMTHEPLLARLFMCLRDFGGPWLGLEAAKRLRLPEFLETKMTDPGDVPWSLTALALVLGRLVDPSSELRLAEHIYGHSAMDDLLSVPAQKMNDDRLYRALDKLLPHKDVDILVLQRCRVSSDAAQPCL